MQKALYGKEKELLQAVMMKAVWVLEEEAIWGLYS